MRHRVLPSLAVAMLLSACAESPTIPSARHVGSVSLSGKNPAPTLINVTTTIHDADATGALLMTRSDDRTGQGFATYTSVNKVSSHIIDGSGWQLVLTNQTARTVYLILASQGIAAPDGYYSSSVEVYSRCFDAGGTLVSFSSIPAGTSNDNCTFGLDFSSGRTKYKLAMGPDYPGTGHATVTCNAAASGSCANWTIVPNLTAAKATVANLYHFANNGSLIFDGAYHNSFDVRVAN